VSLEDIAFTYETKCCNFTYHFRDPETSRFHLKNRDDRLILMLSLDTTN